MVAWEDFTSSNNYIHIYIYTQTQTSTLYVYISISLSLYIYIYSFSCIISSIGMSITNSGRSGLLEREEAALLQHVDGLSG